MLPGSIFKAYDIRGLFPDEIDGDASYRIARAFAVVLAGLQKSGGPAAASGLKVALAHDMRESSPMLAERFRQGLIDAGCQVTDIGMAGTEMLYYTVGSRELDGGAVITASHNPRAYAGIKLVREGALALSSESGIEDVKKLAQEGDFENTQAERSCQVEDVYREFQSFALGFIDPEAIAPMRILVDGSHGMAGRMLSPILESLPLELVKQNFESDGNFPESGPNPFLAENQRRIAAAVLESGCSLGIAWDGDGDRCFFIDGEGNFLPGDFLTALLAKHLLRKQPGATVIYDIRASRAVKDTVERAGGTALVNRVGHSFIKARMRETGALFAGEVSGHYYFRDFWCADSGALPALLMLELLSQEGKPLAELLSGYRSHYFITGEINSEVDDQQAKMEELARHYADGNVSWIDGVSVDYDNWHFNVRPSNTEPLLRLNLEALSQDMMERKRDEVLRMIRSERPL